MCYENKPIEEIEYEMAKLRIYQDDTGDDPRNWDNSGTMVCWHRRYTLGDNHNYHGSADLFRSIAIEIDPNLEDKIYDLEDVPHDWSMTSEEWDNHDGMVEQKVNDLISKTLAGGATILELFLYDHGGITMRSAPFSCPWDSGQVGYIYITHEQAKKEYGWKKLTKKRLKLIETYLEWEVENYDQYLRGDVYYFNITDNDGEVIDSCGGFYGFDFCLQESRSVAEITNVQLYCEAQRNRLKSKKEEVKATKKRQVLTELQLAVI